MPVKRTGQATQSLRDDRGRDPGAPLRFALLLRSRLHRLGCLLAQLLLHGNGYEGSACSTISKGRGRRCARIHQEPVLHADHMRTHGRGTTIDSDQERGSAGHLR
jgi:hypothetical protein